MAIFELINCNSMMAMPSTISTAWMQSWSMKQAKARVTGPANGCEKTMPSGVRMLSVLVFMRRVFYSALISRETRTAG